MSDRFAALVPRRVQAIRVGKDGEPINAADLIENKGWKWATTGTGKDHAEWCFKRNEHDPRTCAYLHPRPGFLIVDNKLYPQAAVVNNAALCNVKEHRGWHGKRCIDMRDHDFNDCKFVHFVAVHVINTHGEVEQMRIDRLFPTPAVAEVLNHHPNGAPGRLCPTADDPHDLIACPYVHLRPPEVINLQGKFVSVERLVRNRAVEHFIKNPEKEARLCPNRGDHDVMDCTYVHARSTESVASFIVTAADEAA